MKGKLEQILHDTTVNLFKVSIFYIPESLLELMNIQKTKDVVKDINKLVLIDKDGFTIDLEDTKAGMFILSKKRFLDENIILLYDFKENNSKGGFEYVLEKYGEMVNSLLYLSEWLNSHVQDDMLNITTDQKTAFNLQHQFFLSHKHEFEKKFSKKSQIFPNSKLNTKTILSNLKPIVPKLNKQFVQKPISKGLDRREHIKKLKADTRAKAENYLLETVFGVNIIKN
ncbi:hypothetical protein [Mangrovimonas cancribranchiae]|uniref:Uncharacterized protein n=1 Tax=Mangrovimonas cancribranchiae TaxID=3080055 RepID=A0AAU6P4Z9_9FLAO